jgi:hypothetical protein
MKSFLIFILLFIAFSNFAQQRITSHITEDTSGRAFVKEVNGQNYLINIYQNDEIKVSTLSSVNTPTLLYTTNLFGLGSTSKFDFYKSKIIIMGTLGINYFDFITQEGGGVSVASSSAIFGDQVLHANQNSFIVKGRTSNSTGPVYFYFDFEKKFEILPSELIASSVGEQHVFAQQNISSTNREYYIYSPYNERAEIIIDATNQTHGIYFSDNYAWYIENENYVQQMDLTTYKRKDLGIKSSYNKPFKKVITQDDQLLIYQGTKDSTFLELYALASKTKIKELKYQINGNLDFNFIRWNGEYIYFKTTEGTVGSIHITSGQLITFEGNKNYSFHEWPLIQDKYLLTHTSSSIQIQDLHTGLSFSTPWSGNLVLNNPNIIKVGNFYYTSMKANSPVKSAFHKISILKKSIENSTTFDQNNSGLLAFSKLIKIDNDLFLSAKDLYKVKSANASQINQSPLLPNETLEYQVVSDGKVHYYSLEGDSLQFYSYEKGVESKIVTLPKPAVDIYNFAVTPLFIYTIDKNRKFFRINRNTRQSVRLSNYENTFLTINNASHQGNFFFKKDNQIIRLGDDGSQKVEFSAQSSGFRQMGDNLYLIKDQDLLIWKNNKFEKITSELNSPNIIEIPEQSFHLVSSSFNRRWNLLYNDSLKLVSHDKTEFAILNKKFIGKDFALFKTDLNENIILDYKQKNYVFFDQDHPLINSNLLSIFIMQNDTLALVYENAALKTYKLTHSFVDPILISETQFDDAFSTTTVAINDEYGLLQTATNHYYISRLGKVTLLPDIKVAYGAEGSAEIDGENIYFLATDYVWGRQLYSLRKNDVTSTENLINNQVSQNTFRIFPNPTSNVISFVNIEQYSNIDYNIIDNTGKQIKSGTTIDGKIQVNDLNPGQYYVKIMVNKISIIRSFLKI